MREKRPEELERLLSDWREELFKLSVQSMMGQTEKSSRTREIKKNIARILTVLKEQLGVAAGREGESKES